MSRRHDDEYTEYVSARIPALRRVAYLLCQDWHRADDLVQSAITKLYVHWGAARAADNMDAYVRAILVREFLNERRSGWARRVIVGAEPPERAATGTAPDRDAAVDMRLALTRLPRRQRATLVLRYYCDLTVFQVAEVLGCSPGTVKSQTSKALDALRRTPEVGVLPSPNGQVATARLSLNVGVRNHG